MSLESAGKPDDAGLQQAAAGVFQAEATDHLHVGQSALPHKHHDDSATAAAKSAPLKQLPSGDSAIHFEVGRAPGLNTDHFHQQSRDLLFQHDSHGMPVSFHEQGDVSALGLPQIQLYDAGTTYPAQHDTPGTSQPGRDGGVPAQDRTALPPDSNRQQPAHDAVPPMSNNERRQPQPEFMYHTVQHGDNLWKIARESLPQGANNHVVANYVHQIEADNPMRNPNLIMPGEVIKLRQHTSSLEHDTAGGAGHVQSDEQRHESQHHYGTAQHMHHRSVHHPHIHTPSTPVEQGINPDMSQDRHPSTDDMTPSTNQPAVHTPATDRVTPPTTPPVDHATIPANHATIPATDHTIQLLAAI